MEGLILFPVYFWSCFALTLSRPGGDGITVGCFWWSGRFGLAVLALAVAGEAQDSRLYLFIWRPSADRYLYLPALLACHGSVQAWPTP
jgi:hypothetical protein